jgi:hypothetical protein
MRLILLIAFITLPPLLSGCAVKKVNMTTRDPSINELPLASWIPVNGYGYVGISTIDGKSTEKASIAYISPGKRSFNYSCIYGEKKGAGTLELEVEAGTMYLFRPTTVTKIDIRTEPVRIVTTLARASDGRLIEKPETVWRDVQYVSSATGECKIEPIICKGYLYKEKAGGFACFPEPLGVTKRMTTHQGFHPTFEYHAR